MSKIFEKKKKEIKSWLEPHKKSLDRREQRLRDFTAGPATAVSTPAISSGGTYDPQAQYQYSQSNQGQPSGQGTVNPAAGSIGGVDQGFPATSYPGSQPPPNTQQGQWAQPAYPVNQDQTQYTGYQAQPSQPQASALDPYGQSHNAFTQNQPGPFYHQYQNQPYDQSCQPTTPNHSVQPNSPPPSQGPPAPSYPPTNPWY